MQISKILHTGLVCAVLLTPPATGIQAQKKNTTATLSDRITSAADKAAPGVSIIIKFTAQRLNPIPGRNTGIRIYGQSGLDSDFNFSAKDLSGKAIRFFTDGI